MFSNNITLHLKELEKEEQTNPKSAEDIKKIRKETNEQRPEKQYKRSTKLRAGFLKDKQN